MNFGFGDGGHVYEHNFNMNQVFNTPTVLGDFAPGVGIQQGYVGTGNTVQYNHGVATGS